MRLLPAKGLYLSLCGHWSSFSVASELCKWLSPLKTQVSAASVRKLPVLWCCPWLPLPASHGWLWCWSPRLTVSSPGNALTAAPPCPNSKACSLPWELEISALGVLSAIFIWHKVEIMPSQPALSSAWNEVLHKNTFLVTLNVKM